MEIWQDGKWRSLQSRQNPFGTLAFQFGFGLFETILVQEGRPADIEEHIQRLARSISQIDTVTNYSFDTWQLVDNVLLSLNQRKEKNEVLKIIVYREEERWMPLLLMRPYTYNPKDYERGFSLTQSATLRNARSLLVYHKTLNYLENYLERQKARREGHDDTYFLNTEGIITECTAANLFIIRKGELITSPVQEGLLPGIMRMKLLEKAKILGLTIKETPVRKEMLQSAEMVLVTNALLGAMPVSQIDDRRYPFEQCIVKEINEVLGRGI